MSSKRIFFTERQINKFSTLLKDEYLLDDGAISNEQVNSQNDLLLNEIETNEKERLLLLEKENVALGELLIEKIKNLLHRTYITQFQNDRQVISVEHGESLYYVMYILFNYKELSAYASSVYSELYSVKSSSKNDYKNTNSYKTYTKLKKCVEELIHTNAFDDVWNYAKSNYRTKSHPNGYENTNNVFFRRKFIEYSIKQLDKYFKKMIKSVYLYNKENII